MNYYRAYIVVCLLVVAVAFAPALAQGAHKGVVIESVDEDVVEGDAPPAATIDKNTTADKSAAKDSVVHKDSIAHKNAVADKKPAVDKNAAADSSAAHKKPPAKKELDLDALLGTDDADDLLVEEEKVIAPVAVDSASIDTSAVKSSELAGDENTQAADSAEQAVQGRRGGRASAPKTAAKADTANLGPAVIEDGRSINFAHNLKEYRSPRIAMLLSLIVPGLGQAYARSYVKAGAFGAVELATIGVAVYFNSMGNTKKKEAYDFADKNYDVERLRDYGTKLRDVFNSDTTIFTEEMDTTYLPYTYYDADFYNAAGNRQSYYYERIRDGEFTPGWNDSDPGINQIIEHRNSAPSDTIRGTGSSKYVLADTTSKVLFYLLTRVADASGNAVNDRNILAYSNDQITYNAMMDKSKSYYDAVNYTFYVLLLNHIASAIDAGFTARAYNARLLGQESVWNRLSVEQTYVYTGSEVSPGLALRWRF